MTEQIICKTIIFLGYEPSKYIRDQIEDNALIKILYYPNIDLLQDESDRPIEPAMLVIDYNAEEAQSLIRHFQQPYYKDRSEQIPVIVLIDDPEQLNEGLRDQNIFTQKLITDTAIINTINNCWEKTIGEVEFLGNKSPQMH